MPVNGVKQRVDIGGHFVDETRIRTEYYRYNFEEGLKNLEYFAGRFDNLEIIDVSKKPGQLRYLLKIEQQQLVYIGDDLPAGARQAIINIADRYTDNSKDDDNGEEPGWDDRPGR